MRIQQWMSRFVAAATLLASSGNLAVAEVKLPKIFGDNMVLQQRTDVKIFGWADADEKVTVTLTKAGEEKPLATATATGNKEGKFLAKLATPAAGGPYEVTVAGAKNNVAFKNVLLGEVWICGGQSNMEWSVNSSKDPDAEKKVAEFPMIRHFKVKNTTSDKPLDDCQGQWVVCTPQTVGGFTAVGYFFGREIHKELSVPVGLISDNWGGTICEAWASAEGLTKDEDLKKAFEGKPTKYQAGNPNQPTVLYNAMIHPVKPYTIRGALWYQGESNRGRAAQYTKLFPAMIADWRRVWDQGDFPFLFVQLAPYTYEGKNPNASALAEIWEAQLKTLTNSPNTGMAVTTDISNLKDIHPKNKQDVGRRLALWALAKTYGKEKLVYSGPLFKEAKVEGSRIRLTFDHVGGGLASRDGKPLSHFTIAGETGEFVPAKAEIEKDSIVVSAEGVTSPKHVRFGWLDIAEPNFMNKEGLPASPFRTDSPVKK